MSDSYQAVYDAVRSRISSCDVGGIVSDAVFRAFDISFARDVVTQSLCSAAADAARPSVLYRPTLSADGDMWCALLGDDLQTGVAGFGETPAAAMAAFDQAFLKERTPAARLASADTRPQDGDPLGASLASGAVGEAETPNNPQPITSSNTESHHVE